MQYRILVYIDPGTGSMLFTILIGVLGALFYFFRGLIMKIRFKMSGGKQSRDDNALSLVLFADHKRYWNVFEPVCDELESRGIEAVYMTASEDDPALSKSYEHIKTEYIGSGNKAYARLNMLRAKVLVATTPQLDVLQWKRSREVKYYIHILHMPNDPTLYRIYALDYFDAVMLSGRYQKDQIRKLERLRNLPEKDIEIVGIPYMDRIADRVALSNAEGSAPSHKRTVLLAPSWGESGILSKFGSVFIDALIGTGYRIIIRPHPQSYTAEKEMIDSLMAQYPDGENISWNRDNDNFFVLKESDILISDFSGIFFEYAMAFDKPVIYTETHFDKSPYDAYWLEEEPWTFRILPEIGEELNESNFKDIKSLIDRCIEEPRFAKGRDKAREETWMYRGEGAKRAVDFIGKYINM